MKTIEVLHYIHQYPENELFDIDPLFEAIKKDHPIERRIFNVQIARMVKAGKLQRFKRGVYYRASRTAFGLSKPNLLKVIQQKYIGNKKEIIGFLGGNTLLNQLGMTDQEANKMIIYTRKVKIENWAKKMNVEFKKAPDTLNVDNVDYFEILYLIKDFYHLAAKKDVFYQGIIKNIQAKRLDMIKMFILADQTHMNDLVPHLAKVARGLTH